MQQSEIYTFIHNVFIGILALFPVVNPIGTSFMVNPFFSGIDRNERKKLVRKITLYSFYICLVTLLSGNWILRLFGLSVPVVKVAGGIMICFLGWNMLSGKSGLEEDNGHVAKDNKEQAVESKIFYPITFPMTCGAGTISVLFTLSARNADGNIKDYLLNTSSILISVIVMCMIIYFMFLNTELLIKRLGPKNEVIVNRLMAFLIFCVGLQIASTGVVDFLSLK